MPIRQWLAWALVRVAARLWDDEYHEMVEVIAPTGERILHMELVGSTYGAGVYSMDRHGTPPGYVVHWEEFEPDWLREERNVLTR